MDGEMTPAESAAFEKRLESDPDLRAEVEQARHLTDLLRAEMPADMQVPHADFFNSQIQVRIAQESDSSRRPVAEGGWLRQLFRSVASPWGFAAAAALVALLVVMRPAADSRSADSTWVTSSYTPNPSVTAHTYHSTAAGATVLELDGLPEIPAEKKVAGLRVDHAQQDRGGQVASFHDATGTPLLVMSLDAQGRPHPWSPRSR